MKILKPKYTKEQEHILTELSRIQSELELAQHRLNYTVNEVLIDSIIFEINSLYKRHEYYLNLCKTQGMSISHFTKIS